MESPKLEEFEPNDKKHVTSKPTGSAGRKALLASLHPEEVSALKQFKNDYPELATGHRDVFLMKFIWARKLNVSRAAELLEEHLKWREQWTLDDLDTTAVEAFLKAGVSMWIPGLYNKQGYSASFVVPRKLDIELWKKLGTRGMLHAVWYMTDLASDHDIDIAREGTVVVFDFAGASWSDIVFALKGDSDFDLTKLIESSQNHIPSRIRDVILLNAPLWVRALLSMVKPLLKSSLRHKIHSAKTSDLTDYFAPEHIPTEWGGTLEFDLDTLSKKLVSKRPTLGEGDYVDPSPRSKALIQEYSGETDSKHGSTSIAKELVQPGKVEAQ